MANLGSFVLLNTVIIDAEVDLYSQALDYNPCLDCKICSTACPTGAIDPSGAFNAINCMTHTYRELLGGFTDWTESIVKEIILRRIRIQGPMKLFKDFGRCFA